MKIILKSFNPDILDEDYTSKVSLKCKKSAGPVAVTIETTRGSGGALSSKVGTKFSYAGLAFDKVQLAADGSKVLETSLVPASGTKLSFKGNKGADLGCDYKSGSFVATGKLDVKELSKFSTSACVGLSSGVVVGGSAAYSIAKSSLSAFDIGASYTTGPLFASVTTGNKVSTFNAGLMYKVNNELSVASMSVHSAENPLESFTVGGAYKASVGDVKAKVDNNGLISACLIKEIAPKVTATASGSVSAKDPSTFKYGLGIVM